ncbi:GPI mannosyltransferase 1-like isoform X2 [Asterias amurensis]|uniref:GPI mannosyltransferase 1-like isoform X2 n=1 Tax=Asterias amurensis TaxID=7602 RepID=UPI003AB253CA
MSTEACDTATMQDASFYCYTAFLIRLALMVYGEWQDRTMLVKYTDVDYYVFTDAARYVTQGLSPYERATYRYTPLLAWCLTPNIFLSPIFGKLLFILCDVFTGILILWMLRLSHYSENVALKCALCWLLNPLPITVSSRGNAESVMSALVLLTLYALMKRWTKTAAFLYAVSVHVKIYPITYCLPIYFLLGTDFTERAPSRKPDDPSRRGLLRRAMELLYPTRDRLLFVCVSVTVFILLTASMYYCYGNKFLDETYLYHVTRRDVRHNFSPYFYMLYLTSESSMSVTIGLLAFIPQAVLLLTVSLRYYRDVAFCCFIHTFLFVTFNKVCTSQYFLWYLCLLPLVVPLLGIKVQETLFLSALWFFGQALWLYFAYYLEFEGQNTFITLWLAGLLFFSINIAILTRIMLNYKGHRTFNNGVE